MNLIHQLPRPEPPGAHGTIYSIMEHIIVLKSRRQVTNEGRTKMNLGHQPTCPESLIAFGTTYPTVDRVVVLENKTPSTASREMVKGDSP